LDPQAVWAALKRGEAQLAELERRRTVLRRARAVSLATHVACPKRPGAIYLCRHAVRSKATLRRGSCEVAGGFVAWKKAGLPIGKIDKAGWFERAGR
jgi:hypothetical protein